MPGADQRRRQERQRDGRGAPAPRLAPRLSAASSSETIELPQPRGDDQRGDASAMKENCPSTTRNSPGRRKSSSMPVAVLEAVGDGAREDARIEMPRITPGITSGTHHQQRRAPPCPRKSARSNRKALAVPTDDRRAPTPRRADHEAEFTRLCSSGRSWNMPTSVALGAEEPVEREAAPGRRREQAGR